LTAASYDWAESMFRWDPDSDSIINPLSSVHDRFNVKNQFIKGALLRNTFFFKQDAKGNSDKKGGETSQRQKNKVVQNFYLNPTYKEQVIDVPPRQNITIKDAVIFEPQLIEQSPTP